MRSSIAFFAWRLERNICVNPPGVADTRPNFLRHFKASLDDVTVMEFDLRVLRINPLRHFNHPLAIFLESVFVFNPVENKKTPVLQENRID